ncbi:RsmB/NOP family class I SAM-dependent RNA methyltransferase [Gemmatimonadota bacterium]
MPEVTRGRRIALEVLRSVSRGRRLDRALAIAFSSHLGRERKWVHEVSYGVTRLRGRLDYLLDLHLRKGGSSLSSLVLDLLRLGAYQILYMEGVPSYAALSQTVAQVREVGGDGGARLANGVLRSLEREGGSERRFPSFETDPLSHLTTWGSHPRWLARRWLARWGPEEVLELTRWNNRPAPLFFRPLGLPPSQAVELIKEEGWTVSEVGEGLPCLLVEGGINPAILLQSFRGIVQDPGAALVTIYADPPEGDWIADLCAAPGGKTLALAERGAYVLAADAAISRLKLLRENVARVGSEVAIVAAAAQKPPVREAPFVLLDVPCSGTGTLRRHPDARWRMEPATMSRLADLQAEILDAGAKIVAPGGHLVYATCTLEPEENEAQVETFLLRHPEFRVEETGVVDPQYLDDEGRLYVLPQRSGFDGAFGARMRRRP